MKAIGWVLAGALLAAVTATLLWWSDRTPSRTPPPAPPLAVHPRTDGGTRRPHLDRVGLHRGAPE
jgi:hypothetical protein